MDEASSRRVVGALMLISSISDKYKLTILSLLAPLRAACKVQSFLLLDETLKMDTACPSSLIVPRACVHPEPQASPKGSPMVYGNAGLLLTSAESFANILMSDV